MKKLFVILLFPAFAFADGLNLSIPQAAPSYQNDKFRAGNLDCSNAIGSSTNLEFGIAAITSEPDRFDLQSRSSDGFAIYGRVTIPLGRTPDRINCNTLYNLEMESKRLEVQKLKREIELLRNVPDFE